MKPHLPSARPRPLVALGFYEPSQLFEAYHIRTREFRVSTL